MAEIVRLDDRRPPPPSGNGARESLIEIYGLEYMPLGYSKPEVENSADWLLIELWARGFKIVPLDGTEE